MIPTFYEQALNNANDFMDDEDITQLINTYEISLVSINIIVYIGGWAVYRLKDMVNCGDCFSVLFNDNLRESTIAHLIRVKNRGNLVVPSKDVISICLLCEKLFRENIYNRDSLPYQFNNPYKALSNVQCHNIMCDVIKWGLKSNIFPEIQSHVKEHKSPRNHVSFLIKKVALKYLDCRFHYAANSYNIDIKLKARKLSRHQSNTFTKVAGQ